MENILTKICNTKKNEIAEQKKFIINDFLLKVLVNYQLAKEFLFEKKILTDLK